MADISQITDTILKKAEAEADEIFEEYKNETETQLKQINTEHQNLISKIEEDEKVEADIINKRFDYELKKVFIDAVANTKLSFFKEVMESAKEKFKSMPEKEYCQFLEGQISTINPEPKSTIYFGNEDLKRLPKSFFTQIAKKFDILIGGEIKGFGFKIQQKLSTDTVTIDSFFEENKETIFQKLSKYEASV